MKKNLFCVLILFFFTTARAGAQTPPLPTLSCQPSTSGDLFSRPVPCEACNLTDKLAPACASTVNVNNQVRYQCSDEGAVCDNRHYLQKTWGGTITIDLKDATLPFAGKTGQENEQKYLADYFEGTRFYSPQVDLETCKSCTQGNPGSPDCLACQEKLREILLRGGVFPKIASLDIQDEYKRQMVERAVKSLAGSAGKDEKIHDYRVSYAGFSATLSQFADHLKPKKEDFTNSQTYQVALDAWTNSDGGKWAKLWLAVPMFSREDTPGWIGPYLGSRPRDQLAVQNPDSQIEKVPHLARLYEVTGALQKLLLPFASPLPSPSPTPTPAPLPTPPCGLAEASPVPACNQTARTDLNPNDTLCCQDKITVNFTATDSFVNSCYEDYKKCFNDCKTRGGTDAACNAQCDKTQNQEVNRQVGVALLHPYLEEIWQQTTNSMRGFLNIFRSQVGGQFADLPAATKINYQYQGDGAIANPSGQLYFPHLGGLQTAKEFVIRLLNPSEETPSLPPSPSPTP